MERYLQIAQIAVSVLLIISILLQNRGAGLGGIFGGEGNVYRTKRGLEKGLFVSTIIFAIIFFGLAIWNILIS
ncbi:MAG TPA: preprotein translocase subunit SecG [Candidatus Veblenbacteria bacterium]|uniref:Protein-export membrane protein SecG n=2 Tax=Candidatus Vebleniibacteriota TaxID=1817921 RepID=A0A1G2Q2N8_9BACT|nr:MAG: preprotein translocase subunit SecG [Candidatus Veblenbacteria bacterium RIFOXYA2_FULL_43_9]OHA56531.1 MAG: preprotein translocase subunit SecG [Candidatus Veblenbacteria bacterium RIFOXYC2_FULL_42_11]HAO81495.1 preprotein translocase subunit SecG [Candidatus Veblenbacteria bacterium]HBH17264.1 preprotein translocase subunit SecG [Candidatus Veblenbacteria bacterium]HBT91928.1 preprotein translocase subunit SecG [Candidatus Veblenbacteria bacterium]